MAAKFFHPLRTPSVPPQKLKLTSLQKAILSWLYDELHQRRRTGAPTTVPYPTLVQALEADKATLTTQVRYLMHKGLVTATLPRGAWERYLALTEAGETQARTLVQEGKKRPRRLPG
jgi:hypothetical protein